MTSLIKKKKTLKLNNINTNNNTGKEKIENNETKKEAENLKSTEQKEKEKIENNETKKEAETPAKNEETKNGEEPIKK